MMSTFYIMMFIFASLCLYIGMKIGSWRTGREISQTKEKEKLDFVYEHLVVVKAQVIIIKGRKTVHLDENCEHLNNVIDRRSREVQHDFCRTCFANGRTKANELFEDRLNRISVKKSS